MNAPGRPEAFILEREARKASSISAPGVPFAFILERAARKAIR